MKTASRSEDCEPYGFFDVGSDGNCGCYGNREHLYECGALIDFCGQIKVIGNNPDIEGSVTDGPVREADNTSDTHCWLSVPCCIGIVLAFLVLCVVTYMVCRRVWKVGR